MGVPQDVSRVAVLRVGVFLVPCAGAAFCHWENKNIRARNARRRAAATNALQALVAAARDKQDRAHGKRALVRVDE